MFALALAALVSHAPTDAVARVESAVRLFQSSRALIEREIGKDQAIDIGYRLVQDQNSLQLPVPRAYAEDWNEALNAEIGLDVQAVADLAAGRRRAFDTKAPGVYETFVVSSVDGTWLPVAVYVPRGVNQLRPPLALMLHGNPQSETNLLGQPYFRRLADRTGTILVAPWARGTFYYQGVAQNDVYDVLHAAQQAFRPDEKRTFLVGYSMGGFSAFKIGTSYPKWAAVMDVCGALQSDAFANVEFAWRATPVYVVTGKHDSVVPARYPRQTASVLASIGVPTSFYEEDSGEHMLRTLVPSLTAAWLDMHSGVVNSRSVPSVSQMQLPKFTTVQGDEMKP